MTYFLYCAVNAAGVPYDRTFRPDADKSRFAHVWNERFSGSFSIPSDLADQAWKELQANGDRVIKVRVTTSEVVIVEEV